MNQSIRLFYGYDKTQPLGSSLFVSSVIRRSSVPVEINPVAIHHYRHFYSREARPEASSTDFSFTRFLVPYLCDYQGWALFADGADMLCVDDISKLWRLRDPHYGVQVIKQEHDPKNETKFLGNPQTKNQMKNWSSLMLFNCAMCRRLTPEFVEEASGKELHQFSWVNGQIGALPKRWNYLVGVSGFTSDRLVNDAPGIIHWTNGSPYFDEYAESPYYTLWESELEQLLGPQFFHERARTYG